MLPRKVSVINRVGEDRERTRGSADLLHDNAVGLVPHCQSSIVLICRNAEEP